MIGSALGLLGTGLTGAAVGAYLAYTMLDVSSLRDPILRYRSAAVAAGLGCAALGVALAPRSAVAWSAAAVSVLFGAYAWRRQWLCPREAPRYRTVTADESTGLLLVLPDGTATRLRWLARDRVARIGPWLAVHCGLARSVAVFDDPGGQARAVLPHASGFYLEVGGQLLDGVDGSAPVGGGLRRAEVRVVPAAGFRGQLCGTGQDEREYQRLPRLPAARGVQDAMAFGAVVQDRWTALDLSHREGTVADYVLGRWAARARGLPGA